MKAKSGVPPKFEEVLLVDEDQIDNFINERIITSSNFSKHVIVRDSARAALDYLTEQLKKDRTLPQIIFLDLNMPGMDGFGFLREYDQMVKDYPILREKVRIIVLSSSISAEDINKASTNPLVMKYLNKPLSEKYLDAIS